MNTNSSITITRPDDWHLHVRDGAMLDAVVPYTARQFGRAIIMPNLVPPVTTVIEAKAYCDRIKKAVPDGVLFEPLMVAYLTESLDPEEVKAGHQEGVFKAVKLYPAGATTNSASGVTDLANVKGVLEVMQEVGLPLLVHGEVTDPGVDIFDREAVFIERVLIPLLADFPDLKVVFEHVTTKDAVDFVMSTGHNVGATITAHHLMINRNALFKGGIRPHMYCLPVAKREQHRLALRRAAISTSGKFFLGTDSAPHSVAAKETGCGCAGIFTAATAMELYAQVFDEENAIDQLEAFAALNGPAFYGLPVSDSRLTLEKKDSVVPVECPTADGEVVQPFLAGEILKWSVV
jgi:dihydroorotase